MSRLTQNNHRELVVISGEQNWCMETINSLLPALSNDLGLWLGDDAPDAIHSIPAGKATQWLGRERQFVVFNAWSGFDVDAFGAISGVIEGGGVMLLLTPELDQWSLLEDPEHRRITIYPEAENRVTGRYIRRLAQLFERSECCSLIRQNKDPVWQILPDKAKEQATPYVNDCCRTEDQDVSVEAIHKVATGHRRRPLVLTADRGRGKSAALGIAAAQCLKHGLSRIVVTGPSLAATGQVFQHAELTLNKNTINKNTINKNTINKNTMDSPVVSRGRLVWQDKSIEFLAPDELVANPVECDLMLVDEAAALPVPLLESLLRSQSRIVFSSTIHGYEGTGRGFAIRFRNKLEAIAPQWRALHLNQAIRWAENDPLEQLVFSSLLLNASPVEDQAMQNTTADQCEWVHFDRNQLIENESMLTQVFGLLVQAHYRTRPFDLRHFLDGPNIEVYGLVDQGRLAGTILAAREGAIEPSLQEPIWLGQRRVRGHLIPQSLSNHAGIPEAISLKGLRILRVAVHPAVRRKGFGTELLSRLSKDALDKGLDYLGTSFGATVDLLSFWQNNDFLPVRTGLLREAASGCYSLMMLQPLSEQGSALVAEARSRFYDNFLLQLPECLSGMDNDLVCCLFSGSEDYHSIDLTERDWQDIHSFSHGQRLFESCLPAIRKLLLKGLADQKSCSQALSGLVVKVLQQHSWSSLAQFENVAGKKQAVIRLREYVGQLKAVLK
ncbi:tRNA(Met) cytidine acetyltransferase TmcA [Endozoicomonas montiporae]|uniref:tRNA(Met) cytidine acetyltransferase TmcA n=1 Tax=Endozoicomonas montiporae TaxID=1027273 RepID=UPI000553CD62|nr:GNAT family N-acetyltransferase [Endozoicomonas montiporae]